MKNYNFVCVENQQQNNLPTLVWWVKQSERTHGFGAVCECVSENYSSYCIFEISKQTVALSHQYYRSSCTNILNLCSGREKVIFGH